MTSSPLSEVLAQVRRVEPAFTADSLLLDIYVDASGVTHVEECPDLGASKRTKLTMAQYENTDQHCGLTSVSQAGRILSDVDLVTAMSLVRLMDSLDHAEVAVIVDNIVDLDSLAGLADDYVRWIDDTWETLAPELHDVPDDYRAAIEREVRAVYTRSERAHRDTLRHERITALANDLCITNDLLDEDNRRDERPTIIAVQPVWGLRPLLNDDDPRKELVHALGVMFAVTALEGRALVTMPRWVHTAIAAVRPDWFVSSIYDHIEPRLLETATSVWSPYSGEPYHHFDACIAAARVLVDDPALS